MEALNVDENNKKLKDLMWRATKATYPQKRERLMRDIKALNVDGYKYLMQEPPR